MKKIGRPPKPPEEKLALAIGIFIAVHLHGSVLGRGGGANFLPCVVVFVSFTGNHAHFDRQGLTEHG